MIKGYLDGSRDLRYDALAALMADYCERNVAMGRCKGEHKACRFAICPFDEGDPTNPNAWVDALYKSECGIWKRAAERLHERDEKGVKDACQVSGSSAAEQEPPAEPEKISDRKSDSKGGWFRKWLTSK